MTEPGTPWRVPLLVPDLPSADELMPWLRRIDASHRHANFGPLVREFETLLSHGWKTDAGLPNVVTLSSGTAALELALSALSIKTSGQVLVPSFTFAATAGAVVRQGLRPMFCDVAPGTWQLTPAMALEIAHHHPLDLVIPVASLGSPVEMAPWDDFVAKTGIPVLVDAAAAFGNQGLGLHTHVTFSFHATKPFGIGEGGALVTRDPELAARVRRLSNFGLDNHRVTVVGTNAKLSEYAAAVGMAQLKRWPQRQAQRRALWHRYLAELELVAGIRVQNGYDVNAIPATLVLNMPVPATAVMQELERLGIQTRRWYEPPLHRHPAYAHWPCVGEAGASLLRTTDLLAHRALGLPWFGGMTVSQCADVASKLSQVLTMVSGSLGAWRI